MESGDISQGSHLIVWCSNDHRPGLDGRVARQVSELSSRCTHSRKVSRRTCRIIRVLLCREGIFNRKLKTNSATHSLSLLTCSDVSAGQTRTVCCSPYRSWRRGQAPTEWAGSPRPPAPPRRPRWRWSPPRTCRPASRPASPPGSAPASDPPG